MITLDCYGLGCHYPYERAKISKLLITYHVNDSCLNCSFATLITFSNFQIIVVQLLFMSLLEILQPLLNWAAKCCMY